MHMHLKQFGGAKDTSFTVVSQTSSGAPLAQGFCLVRMIVHNHQRLCRIISYPLFMTNESESVCKHSL
jgi:hypothetical protein